MRLYIKMLVLIVVSACLQHYILNSQRCWELSFGLRCMYAYRTENDSWVQQLVGEYREHANAEAACVNAAGG